MSIDIVLEFNGLHQTIFHPLCCVFHRPDSVTTKKAFRIYFECRRERWSFRFPLRNNRLSISIYIIGDYLHCHSTSHFMLQLRILALAMKFYLSIVRFEVSCRNFLFTLRWLLMGEKKFEKWVHKQTCKLLSCAWASFEYFMRSKNHKIAIYASSDGKKSFKFTCDKEKEF